MTHETDRQCALAIIPARYESTRFPGKPIMRETGKFLIEHVYGQACDAKLVSRVVVATDDARIFDAVKSFGGEVVMTRVDHPNGTSRLAEAAELIDGDYSLIVNVQGDEPEIDPADIDTAVSILMKDDGADVATLASLFEAQEDVGDPHIVKVVTDVAGRALYFSRSVIPYSRNENTQSVQYYKHVGLYVYRRSFLNEYVKWAPTPCEQAEQLEQLRIVEHGRTIAVGIIDHATPPGIDTPEQYAEFVRRWKRNH